jgi:hypothetical protein
VGPELVVAGGPDDLGEAAGEEFQRPGDVIELLTDVPGDEQPVLVGLRPERLRDPPVLLMGNMLVAEREQLSRGSRGSRGVLPPGRMGADRAGSDGV